MQYEHNKDTYHEILPHIIKYMDNGWTAEEFIKDINSGVSPFPHYKYNKVNSGKMRNLVQQGRFYYHKELKLISTLPAVNHDVDAGEITRPQEDFFIEQRASYTVADLAEYYHSKGIIDESVYPKDRLMGLLNYLLKSYDVELMLFMCEAMHRILSESGEKCDMNNARDYVPMAMQYLEEIKNNCKYSGGDQYVQRSRPLFD